MSQGQENPTSGMRQQIEIREPKCKVGYKFERTEKAGKWRSNNSCYIELTIYHVSRSLNILTHLLLQS